MLAAVAFATLGVRQAALDSLTWDEGIYLAAGLATLEFREVAVNFEHPPLAKVAAALPVLLADPVVPDTDALRRGGQFSYTAELVGANREAGKLDRLVFLNRLVPLAIAGRTSSASATSRGSRSRRPRGSCSASPSTAPTSGTGPAARS